jgi:hypothetical protein
VPTGPSPCGVAVDADKVYWANGGSPGSLGRSHGAFSPTQSFIGSTDDPCGVAVTNTHIYWTNRAGNSIGRAGLDGTNPEQTFLPATAPCGVAVDGAHIYWSNANDTIGRANLDGTGIDQSLVVGAQGPCGVAVDPTVVATPRAYTFKTVAGANSPIKAFVLANTSSSTLGVSAIRLVGNNRADFVKTGDSCVTNDTPAGSACVFNIRFAPRVSGVRHAALRVISNASNSPFDIPLTGIAADATAPRITRAAIRPAVFAVSSRRDPTGRAHAGGSQLSYVVNEQARATFSIQSPRAGRLVAGHCQRPSHANRAQPRCRRWATLGRLTNAGHAGLNKKHFAGRLRGRALRPGRYRITLVAKDAAGNRSQQIALGFGIVP